MSNDEDNTGQDNRMLMSPRRCSIVINIENGKLFTLYGPDEQQVILAGHPINVGKNTRTVYKKWTFTISSEKPNL